MGLKFDNLANHIEIYELNAMLRANKIETTLYYADDEWSLKVEMLSNLKIIQKTGENTLTFNDKKDLTVDKVLGRIMSYIDDIKGENDGKKTLS